VDTGLLGGICTKGLTLNARPGNTGIRLWETPSGLLNSIGLENPGIRAFIKHELPCLSARGPVVIVNLAGGSVEEYAEGARLLNEVSAAIGMIELNISCPNVKAGGMAFGLDPRAAAQVVAETRRATTLPLMVKLSPNAPDLAAVARACQDAGADALSLVNTFKAMAIDIHKRRPVFDNTFAGLSGPCIRPLALRMVWELRDAVKIPIVGMGGIVSAEDALEFLMAGASAVQIGSATFSRPGAMTEVIEGIRSFMRKNGCACLKDLNMRKQECETEPVFLE
jgi:dihydroorotate dehydrogenase (NAD+) catalytic subunit